MRAVWSRCTSGRAILAPTPKAHSWSILSWVAQMRQIYSWREETFMPSLLEQIKIDLADKDTVNIDFAYLDANATPTLKPKIAKASRKTAWLTRYDMKSARPCSAFLQTVAYAIANQPQPLQHQRRGQSKFGRFPSGSRRRFVFGCMAPFSSSLPRRSRRLARPTAQPVFPHRPGQLSPIMNSSE